MGWKNVWGDEKSEVYYPQARADDQGEPLDGRFEYTIHFPAGELPASEFWRITMYDNDGFLVANPIRRYGVGTIGEAVRPELGADGSMTLYVQHESPGADREANWLPAPEGGFFLMMRMYQPDDRTYRGEYTIPAVTRNR